MSQPSNISPSDHLKPFQEQTLMRIGDRIRQAHGIPREPFLSRLLPIVSPSEKCWLWSPPLPPALLWKERSVTDAQALGRLERQRVSQELSAQPLPSYHQCRNGTAAAHSGVARAAGAGSMDICTNHTLRTV